MAVVKVRNLNKHPFEQKHKNGRMIHIAAGEYVEMDEEDAVVFLGQFKPFKVDNKGNHDPQTFKMLKIERDPGEVRKDRESKIICPVCREQTSSYIELEAHQRLMHDDQRLKDPEYETYLEQKAKGNAKSAGAGAKVG